MAAHLRARVDPTERHSVTDSGSEYIADSNAHCQSVSDADNSGSAAVNHSRTVPDSVTHPESHAEPYAIAKP